MGHPDRHTRPLMRHKLIEVARRSNSHGYSVSRGSPRLRKAIADWYGQRYDVDLDYDTEAIVTIGSKEGLAHLMLATLEKGDTVLVPNPSYPIHIRSEERRVGIESRYRRWQCKCEGKKLGKHEGEQDII